MNPDPTQPAPEAPDGPRLSLFRRLRSRWYTSLLMDVAIALPILWGVFLWQERGLLPESGEVAAPAFELAALDGSSHRLTDTQGKKVLLYFFAPWCSVCHASIENVQAVREDYATDDLAIYVIAMDWQQRDDVEAFVEGHGLSMPVLLGTPELGQAYQLGAFPTYYVLDEAGRIVERSVGYSTGLGLRFRL